jgi:hypothetical protein
MKKLIVLIVPMLFLFASCCNSEKNITVTNNTNVERTNEMVEVSAKELGIREKTQYILKDTNGEEIAYQLVYNGEKTPQLLIFQATIAANSAVTYVLIKGKPAEVKAKTFARYIPERKDDFAWENDLAAYRMYGPLLANENPSNGVDLWLKRTDELIVDKFYHDDLNSGLSYHIDHGLGLDCYKVGYTLGAGGIAPYIDGKLYVGNYYSSQKMLDNGPLRSTFVLTYDSVLVGNTYYNQTITISTDAGALMNKAIVTYIGDPKEMELAAGIFLHDEKGLLIMEQGNGIISYAEDAVSEIEKLPSGRNYVASYVPATVNNAFMQDTHALLLSSYNAGDAFIYYFGGGWSKWGYETDEKWFAAVKKFTFSKKNQLKVCITK